MEPEQLLEYGLLVVCCYECNFCHGINQQKREESERERVRERE